MGKINENAVEEEGESHEEIERDRKRDEVEGC